MMKTLDSFKKAVKPKRKISKLLKFRDEIFDLYNSGYRVQQIQDFLATNGVKISKQRIWDFIAKKGEVVVKTTKVETKTEDGATVKTKTKSKALDSFLNRVDEE